MGKPLMTVEVKLETEGTPGRHPDVTKPQFLVNKVEIVVQALSCVRFQEGFTGRFVVPRFIGLTCLHGRENMNKARMAATALQSFGDDVFLADMSLADELDLNPVLLRQPLSIGANSITQGFCKMGIIEDANLMSVKIARHSLCKAETGENPLDDDPVVAGNDPSNLVGISLNKRHGNTPLRVGCRHTVNKIGCLAKDIVLS